MMLIYVPVKFELYLCYKRTNERAELHQLSNLAMMVMHLPVKFEFDWTGFERILAMMLIYVPVKFEFDRTNRF